MGFAHNSKLGRMQAFLNEHQETLIQRTEWHSMDTAPKDGTRIVVKRRPWQSMRYPIVIAYWQATDRALPKHSYWHISTTYGAAHEDDLEGWLPLEYVGVHNVQ